MSTDKKNIWKAFSPLKINREKARGSFKTLFKNTNKMCNASSGIFIKQK